MAESKEQNKIPEEELNEMEISSLSDAQFKTLVIRILQELTGYFNGIKKTQADMKGALSEIKKNLQRTNSGGDEAKNQISNLEHKEGKAFNQNSRKALAGVAQWIEHGLRSKGSQVQLPIRAHTWVVGQVLSGDHVRGNHTLMFLSLSSSLPSLCLKINKIFF